jgi:hypothetical protein
MLDFFPEELQDADVGAPGVGSLDVVVVADMLQEKVERESEKVRTK